MSASDGSNLTDKQLRILNYLREHVDSKTHFKSRYIADDLGYSPIEVGANMAKLAEQDIVLSIEKWGSTHGATWRVKR